jgi:chloride channel protein, CIC family
VHDQGAAGGFHAKGAMSSPSGGHRIAEMADPATAPKGASDPESIIGSSEYRRLLVAVAAIGLFVSLAAWGLLTLVPLIQDGAYKDLPNALGFGEPPWWWPLPIITVAGLITAFVIVRMRGGGGGVPADGLASGPTPPEALPGVMIAALATLGLGLVLGPSSPVIGLGAGLSVFLLRRVASDAPDRIVPVVAAAGSFAAFAMVFQSPVIAAVILVEAAGLGGAMLPVVLLPGLLAAGIGSLVYLGMGQLTGLSTDAYALKPLSLPSIGSLTVPMFAWAVVLGAIAALVGHAVIRGGRAVHGITARRAFVLVPVAGIVVGGCAIAFAQITGQTENAVLFSGSRALTPVVQDSAAFGAGTLAALVLFKAVAWSVSMGSFRGGPVFPAIFLGTSGGLLASYLPGLPEGAAVAIVMGATVAAVMRLPLSSVVIALLLTSSAGAVASPLIIVAVVISYLVVGRLDAPRAAADDRRGRAGAHRRDAGARGQPGGGVRPHRDRGQALRRDRTHGERRPVPRRPRRHPTRRGHAGRPDRPCRHPRGRA